MPSRTKQKNAEIAARSAALPKIPKELMDQLVSGPMTSEEVNAATMAFKKALIERVMGAEREAIDHGRQVHLAGRDLELGEVGEPLLLRRLALKSRFRRLSGAGLISSM